MKPRPFSSPSEIVPPSAGPPSVAVGLDGVSSGTANVTSSPCTFLKPIWSFPYSVSTRTWSGTSARKSTVAAPELIFDRSTYSRPLTDRLLSAKFSVPITRIFPSVEISTVTAPLNSCWEV